MITDFCEIEDFFMNMVGVEMIVKVYLIRIKEEIKILKNPLIKGERVKFEKAEFRKLPILQGRFVIFFKMEDATTKEIFYIKPAKTNYQFSIR